MKDLLQYKGKNDYFHITSKRDFDEFVDICLANGVKNFSSGKPLDSSEFYNHTDVYVKIKGDYTLAFVNYGPGWSGRVHEFSGSYSAISTPKATRTIVNSNVEGKKEKKAMKFEGLFKGMGFEIAKTNEFGLDLMTGKIAYLSKDTATIIDGKKDLTTTLPDMVKSIPLMFIPTPVTALVEGDIIKRNNKCGVITKITGSQIQVQNYSGTISNETIPKHVLMQTSLVPKLFNPFDGFGAGTDGQINPMMAMMFMGGDNDGDDSLLSTFMLMQAMQGGAGNNPQMASMLPLLLMKNGGKDDMMKLMMFSGMAGGAGANPFASNPMLPLLLMGDGGFGGDGMESLMMMSMLGGGASPFGGMFGAAPVAATPKAPKAPKAATTTDEK